MNAAFHGIKPEETSVERPRGRSSSPRDLLKSSPLSVRSRSEDRNAHPRRAREEDRIPSYLKQTPLEIREKFEELEWLQRKRFLDGQINPAPDSRWAREADNDAKLRNRYMNVQPWANHRIHLQVPPDCSDYINASPISLQSSQTKEETKYIATQGPKEGQFNHIWRMIWNETTDPAVVVMLTQTFEAGRDKCLQYFPENFENDTLTYNDDDEFGDGFMATVQLLESTYDAAARSTVRQLLLTVGEESKTVWHLLFAGWPDFSIPEAEDRAALVELIRLSSQKNSAPENPRIVHCSAGVGRSGTFITLDHLLRELDEGSLVETPTSALDEADVIFQTVNCLREQRMTMVQSEAQLNFIYQLLKERWAMKHHGVAPAPSNNNPDMMERVYERGTSPKQSDANDDMRQDKGGSSTGGSPAGATSSDNDPPTESKTETHGNVDHIGAVATPGVADVL